jgi:zinc D-Ala-D-Ala carboxypeptidase
MMRISKNFTLAELTKSNTATRLGISNTPDKEGIHKLRLLATELLQPLRNAVGALRVTSGYRSESLNKAITGRSDYVSQHTKCEAVDLQFVKRGKMDNIKIFECLINSAIEFDQCILEFGGATEDKDSDNPDWIHISWKVTGNRRQILVAYKDENNRTKYRPKKNYYAG